MRINLALTSLALLVASCGVTPSEVVNTPTPTLTPQPSAASQPSGTSTPSQSPPARVTIPGAGTGWDTVATVVRGTDRYLALGWHYEPANEVGYGGGPQLWASSDGVAWEATGAPPEFQALGTAHSLVTTPGGEFLLFGNAYDAENILRPLVMSSADGLDWQEERVDLPGRLYLTRVVRGPKGYLLAGREGGPGGLWLSPDGLTWRSVHTLEQSDTTYEVITDIGAGDDGFVAVGITGVIDQEPTSFALASGDGQTWIRSDDPFRAESGQVVSTVVVAPIGGDWVASIGWAGTTARFWRSANGLGWEQASVLDRAPPSSPVLASAGGQLYYSNMATEVPVGQPGGWRSPDGLSWTPVELGDDGVLAGAYQDDRGLILLGAFIVSDQQADATFWLR